MSHNKLRTMAGLAFCPNITELHVDDNRIRAVSHIDVSAAALPDLLSLDHSQTTHHKTFNFPFNKQHLKKLTVLQLRDNMLSNAEALTTLKHNTSLKVGAT